jgi:hypothetical protein
MWYDLSAICHIALVSVTTGAAGEEGKEEVKQEDEAEAADAEEEDEFDNRTAHKNHQKVTLKNLVRYALQNLTAADLSTQETDTLVAFGIDREDEYFDVYRMLRENVERLTRKE